MREERGRTGARRSPLASEEVDSVALPSVVASAGAGDVGVSDVVMMPMPSGRRERDETRDRSDKERDERVTNFAV